MNLYIKSVEKTPNILLQKELTKADILNSLQ